MASIRDNFLMALVARLSSLGWNAQLRADVNVSSDSPVVAVVVPIGEDKTIANNEHYNADLSVAVWIIARVEDASPTIDAGNPFRYLDRLVVLAEKKLHDPDDWGLSPDYERLIVNGHEVADPSEENQVEALLRLTFRYRHHFQDPEQ